MVKFYKKAKSFFHLHLIYFDSNLNKFAKRRNTIYNLVKIITCLSIVVAICLHGFYSILFIKLGIPETTFIIFVLLILVLSLLAPSPMLIQPDPFVALMNARHKLILANVHGNLISKYICIYIDTYHFYYLFTQVLRRKCTFDQA